MSERLRRFGRQVLLGDLAVKKDKAHLIDNVLVDEIPAADDEADTKDKKDEQFLT